VNSSLAITTQHLPDAASAPMRNRAKFRITDTMLALLLTEDHHNYEVQDGIPKGARILGAQYDLMANVWTVGVEHESLPYCREGSIPITIDPILHFSDWPAEAE